jgi:hypothetical protein
VECDSSERSAKDCLDYALADRTLVGVWGGTTDAESRQMRRKEYSAQVA